jgi:nitrogen-specific signal transduction histidine kinase
MDRKRKSLEGPGKSVNAPGGGEAARARDAGAVSGGGAGGTDGPDALRDAILGLAAGRGAGWPSLASWTRAAARAAHVLILLRTPDPRAADTEPLAAAAKTDMDGVSDRPRVFAYARLLAGWVARTRDVADVSDAREDPRFPDPPPDLRAALAVPVVGTGEIRGAVVALYTEGPPPGDARAGAVDALRLAAAAAAVASDRDATGSAERRRSRRADELETELAAARRWSAVGRMALDIAEEIKNPLAGLSTAVHRLEASVPETDDRRPLLDVLSQEIEHLNRLVAEQIELGNRGDPRLVPEDVNRLLQECVALCADDLKGRKVRVTPRMGAGLPPLLLDPDLMRRVFLNLLRAGITHAAPGGRIKVQSKRMGKAIEVLITADGTRDPGQSLENLWKPFMGREGGSVSSESIQRILRDHRAMLTVSTTPDWPLVFSLVLPIADNQDRRQPAPDRRAGGDRRRDA